MVFSTDWWLKRAFKFALKRYLGRLLKSEVDLEQLNVQLGRGTLELRGVLLDCSYLNEQLGAVEWEVSAGYVGCMRLVIPLTSLNLEPCSIDLEEALLTIRPRHSPAKPAEPLEEPSQADDSPPPLEGLFEAEDGALGSAAIADGIAKVAGGIGNILQRLRVQAAGVRVRVELPCAERDPAAELQSLIVLKLGSFLYEGESSPPTEVPGVSAGAPVMELQKQITFSGLTVELFEAGLEGTALHQPASPASPLTRRHSSDEAGDSASVDSASGSGSPFESIRSKDGESPQEASRDPGLWGEPLGSGWQDSFFSKDGQAGRSADDAASDASSFSDDESRHLILCGHEGEGCSGSLQLHLTWQSSSQQRPKAKIATALDPVQVQLHARHLVLLSHLLEGLKASAAVEQQAAAPGESREGWAPPPPASRSFLADILLPDTTAVAHDLLYQSWRADRANPAAESEFHDAESFLGSIRSGISSFVSASATGVAQGASFLSAASGIEGMGHMTGTADHPPLAAELGGVQLQLDTQNLNLVFWYPTEEAEVSGAAGAPNYAARLSVEMSDVSFSIEAAAETSVKLDLFRVEAVEHIPVVDGFDDCLAPLLPETARIPDALPPITGCARQVPNLCGVSISPMRRSGYASMMSQISALTASIGPNAASGARVQIWPVLCIAGGSRATSSAPSVSLTLVSKDKSAPKPAPHSADVKLRPVTFWLGLPFVRRLHRFLEPLILELAAAAMAEGSDNTHSGGESQRAAVTRAIDCILDDLDGLTAPKPSASAPSGFNLLLRMPHACVICLMTERPSSDSLALVTDLASDASPYAPTASFSRTPGSSQPLLDVSVSFSRLKSYLVRADRCSYQADSSLSATCILDAAPKAGEPLEDLGTAIGLDIRWQIGSTAAGSLADMAWTTVSTKTAGSGQGIALDVLQLQETASAAAVLTIHGRAKDVCLQLAPNDLAALWSFAQPLIQWQAETTAATALALGLPLPLTEASPLVLDLECGVRCNLMRFTRGPEVSMRDRADCEFQVDAAECHVFVAAGVDARAASSIAAVQATGVRIAGGPSQAVLFTSGATRAAGLEVLHAQRQLAASSLEAQAQAAVSLRGFTISTMPGDLTFSWAATLGAFLVLPPEEPPVEPSLPCGASSPVGCAWHLQMLDFAVRDEPAGVEEEDAAAALLVEELRLGPVEENGNQVLEMRNLSLLAAGAGSRGASFSAADSVDLPGSRLLSCGYVCLAQEGGFTLTMQPARDGDSIDGEDSISKTEISNRRLHFPLTKEGWRLLNRLVVRWSAALGGERRPREDFDIPDQEPGASRRSIAVMAEVEEDAFSNKRRRHAQEAEDPSVPCYEDGGYLVPIPGGLVDPDEDADVPGGAPVIIEDFFKDHGRHPDRPSQASGPEEEGVWYEHVQGSEGLPHLELHEEYVKPPPPGYVPPTGQKCALGPLPEGYSTPVTRFTMRNFHVVVALCQAANSSGQGSGDGGHATTARVELQLEEVCLQVDVFESDSPHARRLALSVRSVELKDSALRGSSTPWEKVFSQHVGARSPRGGASCLLTAELESVRPDSGSSEELRLKVSSLPLRLRLDQNIVTFLQSFFAADPAPEVRGSPSFQAGTEDSPAAPKDEAEMVFFQHCEVKEVLIVADYKPRRLDVAALRAGNLAEVLNITAWSDVSMTLPHLKLAGVHGWDGLGAALAEKYLSDITSSQVRSFIRGIKPIQSILRIGTAAGQLLAIPAEALRGRPEASYGNRSIPFSRQIQRGVFALVRAIIAEMLGMSAGALGGIHLVLAGPSAAAAAASSAQPSNVSEGMRQAARRLSSGFGEMGAALKAPFQAGPDPSSQEPSSSGGSLGSATVRALRAAPGALAKPLSGGAAAARCALLGAKNALDPERYENKKLGR